MLYSNQWLTKGDPLRLGDKEIHLWLIVLNEYSKIPPICNEILSDEELERSCRFKFDEDKRRFVLSHSALRILTARYMGCDIGEVVFRMNKNGKPEIRRSANPMDLKFNLSHSGDYALIGFTFGSELGVDIEKMDRDKPWHDLAKRYYSDEENKYLLQDPDVDLPEKFFEIWTLKEAYLKGIGRGITMPLKEITISQAGDSSSFRVSHHSGFPEADSWRLELIIVDDKYKAATAFSKDVEHIRQFLLDFNSIR